MTLEIWPWKARPWWSGSAADAEHRHHLASKPSGIDAGADRVYRQAMISVIGLAVVLFASTNVDDIFVLLTFFADPRFRFAQIAAGQYLGLAALFCVSVVASLVSLVLAPEHVGLLGLLPVVIGLKKLWDLFRSDPDGVQEASQPAGAGAILSVAAVTMANGGDNIGVYTPVFATRSALDVGIVAAVFAIMTIVWLAVGHGLVNNPWLGTPIRRYGHLVAPFVLIGLGALILHEAGSLGLLAGYARRLWA